MKKTLIINELKKIQKIANMKHEELYEKYPFTRNHLKENESVYPAVTGIMEGELEHLIWRIERNEFR